MKAWTKPLLLVLIAICSLQQTAQAQIYPTAVTPTVLGPCSIYFEDFYAAMNPKLSLLMQLNDLTVPQRDVYLKVRINGPGIVITSLPNTKSLIPITLNAGVPTMLFGADIADVFDFNKLSFSGISRQQLEVNGRLPEGAYTICFTIMDYEQEVQVSAEGCVPVQLALSDPPQIINPSCGSVVTQINPTNFLFNWMLTNSNSLVDMNNVNYQLNLYEITSNTANPQTAIMNNQALMVWQSDLLNTFTYNYGVIDPVLEVGKRYVYTVQAIENYPKTQIKNNGYSAPCWFYFGYPEGGEIELTKPDSSYQFNLSDIGLFEWKRPTNAIPNQLVSYDYKLVRVNSGQTPTEAIQSNTAINSYTINPTGQPVIQYTMSQSALNNLEKMQPYAWKVVGNSGMQTVAESGVYTFIGPPHVDQFYAANFLIQVTNVTAYDSVTHVISGTGKTILKDNATEFPEFSFQDITLESAGNNLWIMVDGLIEDDITLSAYNLSPKTIPSNGFMKFQPDSIFIDPEELRLGGKSTWQLPIITSNNQVPIIRTEYTKMMLANNTFELAYEELIELEDNFNFPLLEPYNFNFLVDYTSTVHVYQGKYEFALKGFVELPPSVTDINNSTVLVPFRNQKQVNYMEESSSSFKPEQIDFLANADFGLRGEQYIIDLTELKSPGDKHADSIWKGVYYQTASLMIPENGEESNQLICDQGLEVLLYNTPTDSNVVFIDNTGLNFTCSIPFSGSDTLKFNTFPSTSTVLHIAIEENYFQHGECVGNIQIPVVDTAYLFAWTVPISSFGFEIGNIDESLINHEFVFNAGGSTEEKVDMKITRAVFKGNNRIEMDLDAQWINFNATLSNLQGFTAWGNGNIGFDIPNGAASLNSQAIAKSGDYDMIIDYVGCGRDRNAYAFGVSAKMNMAENIAGDNGAPVVNAYSMYLNPLLSGTFTGNGDDPNSILSGFNQVGDSSNVSAATVANANNLAGDLDYLADSLGFDPSDTLDLGGDDHNPLITEGTYAQLQRIVEVAEIFIQFMDSAKVDKATDYVTVAKQALNSDLVRGAVNKDPKEFLQDILVDAMDGLIRRVNQPIVNVTQKATTKFRGLVNDNVTNPINNKITTALDKVFDKIEDQVAGSIEDTVVLNLVKTIIHDTKASLSGQITGSVSASIENNVTKKITDFIELAISKQITDYIAGEIRYMGMELINNGVNASIDFNHIIDNADTLFQEIGDTVVHGVKSLSMNNIVNTAESMVDDALTGIDWDQILQDILNSAVSAGMDALITEVLDNVLSNIGQEALGSLLNNVQFDFSNLGDKIQNGDLDEIVKFDPTNITIKTSACEVHGQLKHTKDDPIYGDHWRAQVDVKLLKPEKLKNVGISALFVTGKTTYSAPLPPNFVTPVDSTDPQAVAAQQAALAADLADSSLFSFWFASLAVSGLQVPLSPIPLQLTGIEGFAYHHMQRESPTAFPEPCRRNKLGLGVGFDFIDLPMTGKIVKLHMQLEVIINEGAWAMEMYTQGKIGNKGGASGNFPPIATVTGIMGYYSALKSFKGEIAIVFNTSPLLCAGGTIKFDFDGLNNTWYVSAGTQQDPMFAKLLCKDWLAITAFVEAQNTGFKAGLDLNIDIQAKSPWVDFGIVEVRGTAAFYLHLNALVDLSFEPEFRLNEAYVYLSAGASIGIDWETAANSGHFTVAGISVAGYAHYKAAPEGNLSGGLSGTVTVLNIDCGINLNVNYDLGNQSDNS
ncbi:MAG: hypothetical protein V4604_08755 [Bacteroidota bacterium]